MPVQPILRPKYMTGPQTENPEISRHWPVRTLSDRIAFGTTKFFRFFADAFFAQRYGHRAIVLETIAAVPGMVGGMMLHMRSLRRMEDDCGWIEVLLDEAANERMHLMTFIAIEKPTLLERLLVMAAQGGFIVFYFLLYAFSPRTAHRLVGYFEEEAVTSYTQFLKLIEDGTFPNAPAPEIAISYWQLPANARLSDVVTVIRADEMKHRDVNHDLANQTNARRPRPA